MKAIEEEEVWDQRSSLKPPPYSGAMSDLVHGITVGDALVDNLPTKALICHGSKLNMNLLSKDVLNLPDPCWSNFDPEQVKRGQVLWLKHLGRTFFALGQALIIGFSISRFAEVLFHSGYANSNATAFERYRETGFAIVDWFSFPLDEATSRARQQICKVRQMHGLARRSSRKLFNSSKGEGVPLSQYDMAEVLLGFTGVVFSLLETEMKITFTCSEKEDMVACWRLIGYYLGIQDEYNLCDSVERMDACFEDYMLHTPVRLATARATTLALQDTAVGGFGMGTGLGAEVWWGILAAVGDSSALSIRAESKPGMIYVGRLFSYLLQYEIVNDFVSKQARKQREEWRTEKKTAIIKLRVLSTIAGFP